jgi:chromosome segregation ATPase
VNALEAASFDATTIDTRSQRGREATSWRTSHFAERKIAREERPNGTARSRPLFSRALIVTHDEIDMADDKRRSESHRVKAEEAREHAEDLRQEADQERHGTEEHRAMAEAARKEAEHFRVLAEEARALNERYREELESIRQEREALRHAAEEARNAAEAARHATIAAVAATADALSANLAQMQFLEDARNTLRQLKPSKPGDVQ